MIEMATQTRVLAVLGATMLGSMMMIPPNFWTDMISFGVGYLIPELFIAAVLAIIAFFTAGTGGAALAARIATYTGKVTLHCPKMAAPGRPASSRPLARQATMAELERKLSDPPRRMAALPDFMQSAPASAVTLGRLS